MSPGPRRGKACQEDEECRLEHPNVIGPDRPRRALLVRDRASRGRAAAGSRNVERIVCKDGPPRHPRAIAQSERSRDSGGYRPPADAADRRHEGFAGSLSISPACGVCEL